MSKLLKIADELRNVHSEVARIESAIAAHPKSAALLIDYKSMTKRQRYLESEFNDLADKQELDVMRYRLLPEHGTSIPLRAVTRALERFQTAVATVYDSIKTGPKQRVKLTAETYAMAGFDFGYTFSGSLGVVLTVPNNRMLLDRSDIDIAVQAFFAGAESSSRGEVIDFARKYGVASVRKIYDWSAAHADFDIAADINMMRGDETRTRLQVASRALRKLKEIIEETSEVTDDAFEVQGRLAGLDVDKKTFHLVALGGEDIEGKWSGKYRRDVSHVLDENYAAKLTKRTKIHFALEKEETDWLLDELLLTKGQENSN